jgi:hypothetical protein
VNDWYRIRFYEWEQDFEIPVPLVQQLVVDVAPNHAIWIENVRGFSIGVQLDLVVVLPGDGEKDLPVFGTQRPLDDDEYDNRVDVAVVVEYDGRTYSSLDRTLHPEDGSSSTGLGHMAWFLPFKPTSEVLFRVISDVLDVDVTVPLDAASWAERIDEGVVHLRPG